MNSLELGGFFFPSRGKIGVLNGHKLLVFYSFLASIVLICDSVF